MKEDKSEVNMIKVKDIIESNDKPMSISRGIIKK